MTHDDVQRWLERYVAAWRTYDPAGDRRPVRRRRRVPLPPVGRADRGPGRDRRAPGLPPRQRDRAMSPILGRALRRSPSTAIGPLRSARAATSHPDGSPETLYHNPYLLAFDGDGRCRSFVEYFVERK